MTRTDDAFPQTRTEEWGGVTSVDVTGGLTRREYFAAHALQGMLAHSTRYRPREGAPENWHDAIAKEAFEIADAMGRVLP